MALRTVVAEVATKKQDFPVGTVAGKFKFELIDSTGRVLSFVDTDSTGASFPLVPEAAGYSVRVSRNGVVKTKAFDIPVTSLTLDVPDVITVRFE